MISTCQHPGSLLGKGERRLSKNYWGGAGEAGCVHLVAVHKDAQDADFVDQGLDGGPAANAEAEDEVVHDENGVDNQHRAPASGPAVSCTEQPSAKPPIMQISARHCGHIGNKIIHD